MKSKTIKVGGHEIQLTHLDKILFPKSQITKEEVISYYQDVASKGLPFYKDRPLTMFRCPDGIDKEGFVQKKIPSYFPKWIDHHSIKGKEGTIQQVLINKEETLIYLANQACVALHLGLSKIDKLTYPSYLIFDLDPSTEDLTSLKNAIKYVKKLLDGLGLTSFIQTTGSRGFHIYIPLKRELTFTKVHAFAKECAKHLAHQYPHEITIEQTIKKRGNRVLIDYARNSYGLSTIAPYSLRAKENAPIATPLHWDEVDDKDLNPKSYTIKNIFDRLRHTKDPWKDMSKSQTSLKTIQLDWDDLDIS